MNPAAWKQLLRNPLKAGSARAVVLALGMTIAGCQSADHDDRPILPLFSHGATMEPPHLALLGSPPEANNADLGIVLTAMQQNPGNRGNAEAVQAEEFSRARSEINILESCFVRDQIIDLAGAFRLANGENPTIGLAEEVIQAHLAERTLARSLLFPTLNLGTTVNIHRGSLLSARGIVQDVNRESLYFGSGADVRGAGTVAIPGVYVVGNLSDAVFAPQVADQRVTRSRFDAAATRNNVLREVAKTYLALTGAEARVLAYRQSEKELQEVAKLASEFAAAGQGREADSQRALAELSLLRSNAQRAEEEVIACATELSRWLSLDDPTVRLRPEPGTPPLIQLVDDRIGLDSLVERALTARPELAARSADVVLQQTRLRQERVRPLVPTISIGFSNGDFGGGSNQVGYRFSHFGGRMDLDVLAVWNLRNLGIGNRAVQNQVRAEIGQAEAHRAAMLEQIRREVAEALAQTTASRQQMAIARRRVETAQNAHRQDLVRAKNREGRLIEVLSSLNLLTSARQDLVWSMIEYSQSQYQLYVALGGMPTVSQAGDGDNK